MKESGIKIVLILTALLSLALGGLFLVLPSWYITLSQAESTNVAWLRNVGANLVALQGFGLLVAAFRKRDTNPLLGFVALTSTAQSAALWYSLIASEFSAGALWAVIVPAIAATGLAIMLWMAWIARRKSGARHGAKEGSGSGELAELPTEAQPVDAAIPPGEEESPRYG